MGIRLVGTSALAAVTTVLLVLTTGCATPAHCGRWFVAAELEQRAGYQLGDDAPASEVVLPDAATLDDGLSEDEAAALAVWNSPAYRELLADLNIAEADVIEAGQLANPELSTMFAVGAKDWELALTVPIDVLVLRPRRVAAAQIESQRVAQRLVQDGLDVIRDARVAHADLVLAERRVQLAEEGSRLRDGIAEIAEARLRAGAAAEVEVAPMRIEAQIGRQEASRATYDADAARNRLRYLLGAELTGMPVEPVAPADLPSLAWDEEQLVQEAVASRADLVALDLAMAAAQERVWLTRHDYWNIAATLPDVNSDGEKGFEAGPGLRMTLPIFHQNQGATARSQAKLDRLSRQYANRRDIIALEVRQAYTRLRAAMQDLQIWRDEVVPAAEAAAESAQQALEEDGVPLLTVLETTRQFITARQREVEAEAEVHRSAAELERSVGRRVLGEPPAIEAVPVFPAPPPVPPAESRDIHGAEFRDATELFVP